MWQDKTTYWWMMLVHVVVNGWLRSFTCSYIIPFGISSTLSDPKYLIPPKALRRVVCHWLRFQVRLMRRWIVLQIVYSAIFILARFCFFVFIVDVHQPVEYRAICELIIINNQNQCSVSISLTMHYNESRYFNLSNYKQTFGL